MVEDWLEPELAGGSWGCCVFGWPAMTFDATSNIPVPPTARSVAVAIAVLMNSRLFICLTTRWNREPPGISPGSLVLRVYGARHGRAVSRAWNRVVSIMVMVLPDQGASWLQAASQAVSAGN